MKPIHVVTYNISFLLKRIILALVLVFYKYLSGKIQTYIIVVVHLMFFYPYFICWCYMSCFKKCLHLVTDILVLLVLAFPIYENMMGDSEKTGRLVIHLFSIGILICLIFCFLALIPKLVMSIYYLFTKNNNPSQTYPKEQNPYQVKVTQNDNLRRDPNTKFEEDKFEDNYGNDMTDSTPTQQDRNSHL
jgi:hypothetical protein